MADNELTENQIQIKLYELSDSLGYGKRTIEWVYFCIITLSDRLTGANGPGDSEKAVRASCVCAALIKDLLHLYDTPLEKKLTDLKIQSSKDIGKIVYGLVDKKLIMAEDGDSQDDFDDIFEAARISGFIKKHKIDRVTPALFHLWKKVHNFLYFGGALVVWLSYTGMISKNLAWIGFSIVMVPFLLQYIKLPQKKRF